MVTGPDLLMVVLGRWNLNLTRNVARITFAPDLDLTAYTSPSTDLRYRILSVVQHQGTLHNGHYKALTKCPNGKWQEVEDHHVRDRKQQDALNPAPSNNWVPYTLLYSRVDIHDRVL